VKQYGLHNFVCFLGYFSGDDTISTAPEEMGEPLSGAEIAKYLHSATSFWDDA
jgi:hypothetical protein